MIDKAEASHGDPSRVPNGFSPGGAAAELGVTRDAIHKAIRRGRLDVYRIPGPGGHPGYYLISQAALDAYKRKHLRSTA